MLLSADAIWLATGAMDMRAGIDKLSLHVQQALGRLHHRARHSVDARRARGRPQTVDFVYAL